MKSLSWSDIEDLTNAWQELVGGRLQEVLAGDRDLVLGLWWNGQMSWLWFDLRPQCPLVLRFDGYLPEKLKKTKPIQLFLRAHAKNRHLSALAPIPEVGRALRLVFGPIESIDACVMDVWLFPHGQNIFVSTGENKKKMSWSKPRELKALPPRKDPSGRDPQGSSLAWQELASHWQKERGKSSPPSAHKSLMQKRERDLLKKKKALLHMEEEQRQRGENHWGELGQWLQAQQTLQVPPRWQELVNSQISLAENIEHCFAQGAQWERRHRGSALRRQVLQKEIDELTLLLQQPISKQDLKKAEKAPWAAAAEVKAYRTDLAEGLEVYRGRSAKDNLGLLRKAPPWTLWLHLRDYPGSYGFIRREKNQEVSDSIIYKAAHWLVSETIGKKMANGVFAVVCTECRFVRPIKGDRLGRVHFQKERVFNIDLE